MANVILGTERKENLNVRIKIKYIEMLKDSEESLTKAVEIAVLEYLKKRKYL